MPERSAVSAEFKKALAGSKGARKRWDEAKKVRNTGGGNFIPDVPDGQYKCRVTASGEKTQRGDVRVKFRVAIAHGELRGKSWNVEATLIAAIDNNEKLKASIEERGWETLSKALQCLCDVDEKEFDSWDLERVFEEIELIDKDAPYCSIGCKHNFSPKKDKAGKPMKDKDGKPVMAEYFNTYWNGLLTDEQIDEIEEAVGTDADGSETDESADYEDGSVVDEGDDYQTEEEDEDGSVIEDGSQVEEDNESDGSQLEEEGDGEEDQGAEDSKTQSRGRSSSARSSGGRGSRSSRSSGKSESNGDAKGGRSKSSGAKAADKPSSNGSSRSSSKSSKHPLGKGKYVFYKPPKHRNAKEFEIKSVNQREETYRLKEYEGELQVTAPWSECEESK